MGGDWSHDHPVVVGGSPYTGMSVFLIAKDPGGLGGLALGAALGEHLADAVIGGPALCLTRTYIATG